MTGYECAFLVFSKAPVPGTVKTRLIPPLNEIETAELYQQLVERTLNLFTDKDIGSRQIWCTPVIDHPFFLHCKSKYAFELFQQEGKGLGERMHNAIAHALTHYESVVLTGCDCPILEYKDLLKAKEVLESGYDAVLGPTEDGGYYLIGMQKPYRELFMNIEWGNNTVLTDTRKKIEQLNLKYVELPEKWDLDTVDDLKRYQDLISANL